MCRYEHPPVEHKNRSVPLPKGRWGSPPSWLPMGNNIIQVEPPSKATVNDFNVVYKVLLNEVINDNVYFKKQNLCKHHVLHGHCHMRDCCLYDHPDDLMQFFTGIPGTACAHLSSNWNLPRGARRKPFNQRTSRYTASEHPHSW